MATQTNAEQMQAYVQVGGRRDFNTGFEGKHEEPKLGPDKVKPLTVKIAGTVTGTTTGTLKFTDPAGKAVSAELSEGAYSATLEKGTKYLISMDNFTLDPSELTPMEERLDLEIAATTASV